MPTSQPYEMVCCCNLQVVALTNPSARIERRITRRLIPIAYFHNLASCPGLVVSTWWGSLASCAPVVYRRSGRVHNPPQATSLPHRVLHECAGCSGGAGTLPWGRREARRAEGTDAPWRLERVRILVCAAADR